MIGVGDPDEMNNSRIETAIEAYYVVNSVGTFSGCMETLSSSLEKWLISEVTKKIPNVLLDLRWWNDFLETLPNIDNLYLHCSSEQIPDLCKSMTESFRWIRRKVEYSYD